MITLKLNERILYIPKIYLQNWVHICMVQNSYFKNMLKIQKT